MKKVNSYIEKITCYFMLWKNYLPITNMVLFGIVIILIGIVVALILLPVTDLKPGKFDKKDLRDRDKIALVSKKFLSPEINEFESIKKNNLFRPSRTEWKSEKSSPPPPPVKKEPKKNEKKKVVKKKKKPRIKAENLKLSAIMMFGDTKVALIENVDKSKSKEKFVYVKEGEDVGGYTVKSIEREKLIVEWNGDESEINMYEHKAAKGRN